MKSVERYDFEADQLTFVSSMFFERQRHSACILFNKIVFVGRRVARNSQWRGLFGGSGGEGRSPQRSKIWHFFCKNNFILGLF